MVRVGTFAKSLVAAAAAGAATAVVALQDGVLGTGDIVTVVLSVLGALGVVYVVPNAPASTPGPVTEGPLVNDTN